MRIIHARRIVGSTLATLVLAALAACGSSAASAHTITIGLTYVPNVQFAPFYVAASKGYYTAAGLTVNLHHHSFSEDEFGALSAGQENLIYASGDEVLQAREKSVDVTYITQFYTRYPIQLIVPANSSIQQPSDLRGHTIGIPGLYGADYIGLLALLQQAGLTPNDVKITSIGYTQVQALAGNKIDAVMGYANNEPLQLQQLKVAVRTIPVFADTATPFISIGLAAPSHELAAHPDDVRKFVAATLQGLAYADAHPDEAVQISAHYVPGLQDPQQHAIAVSVLQASIPLWQTAGTPVALTAWNAMATLMQNNGLLTNAANASAAFNNTYLPSSS